ncbi:MAG: hypothetical protein ACXAEX_05050 [Promethearchaeota archaeon]
MDTYNMEISNLIKIIAAVISVVIAFIAGIRVFRLSPDNWLNRWFTLFFISSSLGFLLYTIYHLILINPRIIIPLMVTAQIFFNFLPVCLVMTVLILEKYIKVAMSLKYLGTMLALFLIMSIGYFIWVPTLNWARYALGIVDTETEFGLQLFVNLLRIILFGYVVYKYAKITQKIEAETKKKVQWFFAGVSIAIVGLLFNLMGGFLSDIFFEILALIIIDFGYIAIVRGFLI